MTNFENRFVIAALYLGILILSAAGMFIYMLLVAYKNKGQTERKQREIEALNEVALAVGKSMDLSKILDSALRSVLKIGDFDFGFIYLLNEEKKLLEIAAAHGNIPEDIAKRLATLKLGQEV